MTANTSKFPGAVLRNIAIGISLLQRPTWALRGLSQVSRAKEHGQSISVRRAYLSNLESKNRPAYMTFVIALPRYLISHFSDSPKILNWTTPQLGIPGAPPLAFCAVDPSLWLRLQNGPIGKKSPGGLSAAKS